MLDSDLAKLYQVETKRINEAVKSNLEQFPEKFNFALSETEVHYLRSTFSTTNLKQQITIEYSNTFKTITYHKMYKKL